MGSQIVCKIFAAFVVLSVGIGAGIGIGYSIWGGESGDNDDVEDDIDHRPENTIQLNVDGLGNLLGRIDYQVDGENSGVVKFLNIPFAEPMTPLNRLDFRQIIRNF